MKSNIEIWQQRLEECVAQELIDQGNDDAAHDLSHLRRVWGHCRDIVEQDNLEVEPLVLLAAAYFHDIVNLPKQSSNRNQASRLAAEKAVAILQSLSFPEEHLKEVRLAIESHSYSANIKAETMAAKIVQDADRLEALGALGIARVFYVAGKMNSLLFDPEDPWASDRELDDSRYAIDHFYIKLLNLKKGMHTDAARCRAEVLSKRMQDYLLDLKQELSGVE
ncbi:MAG: hypothetical protein ACI909_002504 [Planctomycetota bacterium]|jgi:uncharacterized protein